MDSESNSNGKRLKSARTCIGRAYRGVGDAMSLMSPTADAIIRAAIAQLEIAAGSLRAFVLDAYTPESPDTTTQPTDWYFVDYSLPKSADCPTGRASLRLMAYSDADAIARAAIILEGQGLGFRARINFARMDAR